MAIDTCTMKLMASMHNRDTWRKHLPTVAPDHYLPTYRLAMLWDQEEYSEPLYVRCRRQGSGEQSSQVTRPVVRPGAMAGLFSMF